MQTTKPIPPSESYGFKASKILADQKPGKDAGVYRYPTGFELPFMQGEIVNIGCSAVAEAVYGTVTEEEHAKKVIDFMEKIFFAEIYRATLLALEHCRK